jgi:predicted ATP-grasp superfamily ATP-dependent carboligase
MDQKKVFSAMSKYDVFMRFYSPELRVHLPPSRAVSRGDPFPSEAECETLGFPVFAKADHIHALGNADNVVKKFDDYLALREGIENLLLQYERVLLQGYAPGIGVGAFLLQWNGEELAHFMHRRIHEVPHTGGASSFRRAWYHDEILADARQRLRALEWQGAAMLEYRWDPRSDRFWLMEINARFWGSLHLALFAGVDFPSLLLDAFFGRARKIHTFKRDVACRLTFPREVEYVLSCLRDRNLSLQERVWPILEFFALGANPRVNSDLWFPGDRALYFSAVLQAISKFVTPR